MPTRPSLHDLYATLCEHHAADVARNDANELEPRASHRPQVLDYTSWELRGGIVPDASFDCEAEPTEPNAMPWWLMSREELDAVNERLMGNWLARAGR